MAPGATTNVGVRHITGYWFESMTVRYLDDEVITWSLPMELPIEDSAAKLQGWIVAPPDRASLGSDFVFVQGEPTTWFDESELMDTVSDGIKTAWIYVKRTSPAGSYLVFETDGWLMWLYTPQTFSRDQVTSWLESVNVSEDPSGWPTIDVASPLRLAFPSEFPPMSIEVSHPGFTLTLFPAGCQDMAAESESAGGTYVVKCIDESARRVDVSIHDTTYGSASAVARSIAVANQDVATLTDQ